MSKRNLLLIILSVCLVLSGGCGGSSKSSNGGNNSNSIVKSSDYAGYEVGYKLTYDVTFTNYEENPVEVNSLKFFHHIISVDDTGIFKFAEYNERSPYKWGNYLKKQNNEYYKIGFWDEEDDSDFFYDEEYLVLENPLFKGVETEYGTVLRSEKVTLLGKTYDAWYIEEEGEYIEDDGDSQYWIYKTWFVPYIGMVRNEKIRKYNDEITSKDYAVLSSTKFEAYEVSKSALFSQSDFLKADNQVQGTRSKRSRFFDREKLKL